MAEKNSSGTGIQIDIPAPQMPPPEPVVPVSPSLKPETFVIPNQAAPASAPNVQGSPFVVPPVGSPPVLVSPPPAGNQAKAAGHSGSFFGGVLKFLAFLIVFGALGFGGFMLFNLRQKSQPLTLVYWGLWENPAIIQPVIDAFETANPNVTVEYVKQSHREYRERLVSAIDRGAGPDVFRFHNTWLYMLRNQIEPAPVGIISAAEFTDTYYPVAVNDLVAGATVYGVPLMIDGLGMYINENLFSASGATPPVTWGDMEDAVRLITAPGPEEREEAEITTAAVALGTTNNVEHVSDIMTLLLMQNGANLVNLSGPEAEGSFIYYRKFSDPNDEIYTWNSTFDSSVLAFANGRVAMILAPSWRAFDIKQINPGLNFRVVPVPYLPGNQITWASYWVEGVSAKSPNRELAWQFVKFLTSAESAQRLYSEASKVRLFGEPYARKDLASLISGDPYVGAYITQAQYARSFPLASRTWDNGLNDQMIEYLTKGIDTFLQGGSPTESVTFVNNGFTQVLSRYGLISAAPVSPQ